MFHAIGNPIIDVNNKNSDIFHENIDFVTFRNVELQVCCFLTRFLEKKTIKEISYEPVLDTTFLCDCTDR